MDDVKPIYDDEIDLMQIVLTLWDGKWKIIGIVIVSLLGTFGYQFTQPQSTFDATTTSNLSLQLRLKDIEYLTLLAFLKCRHQHFSIYTLIN